jgi:phosphorylcholine metabolism protein LicD
MELKETEIKKIPRSQEIALELLLQVKYICDKHHIKYTLLFSSLWGAVEYKGFVPWTAVSQIGIVTSLTKCISL